MLGMDALPSNCSFFHHYEEIKMEGRKFLFALECRTDKNEKTEEAQSLKKLDWVHMVAQRLIYRLVAGGPCIDISSFIV